MAVDRIWWRAEVVGRLASIVSAWGFGSVVAELIAVARSSRKSTYGGNPSKIQISMFGNKLLFMKEFH